MREHFPTEDEIFEKLSDDQHSNDIPANNHIQLHPDQALAVIWDSTEDERYWCIGFYVRDFEDMIQVDHLTLKEDSQQWIRPEIDDVQIVQHIQLLPVTVLGEWDFSKRQAIYHVNNVTEIENVFKKIEF